MCGIRVVIALLVVVFQMSADTVCFGVITRSVGDRWQDKSELDILRACGTKRSAFREPRPEYETPQHLQSSDPVERVGTVSMYTLQEDKCPFGEYQLEQFNKFTQGQWAQFCRTQISDLEVSLMNGSSYIPNKADLFHQFNLYQFPQFIAYLKTLPAYEAAMIYLAQQVKTDANFAKSLSERQGWDYRSFGKKFSDLFKDTFGTKPVARLPSLTDYLLQEGERLSRAQAERVQKFATIKACGIAVKEKSDKYIASKPPLTITEPAHIENSTCFADDFTNEIFQERCAVVFNKSVCHRQQERSNAIQQTERLLLNEYNAVQEIERVEYF